MYTYISLKKDFKKGILGRTDGLIGKFPFQQAFVETSTEVYCL